MSRNYFSRFPKLNVSRKAVSSNKLVSIEVSDVLVRYKIRGSVLTNASLFYPYRWHESDTPESVALRYYGAASFFWVVFYSNGAFDLNYDFPMKQSVFNRYLAEKYKTLVAFSKDITVQQFDALPEQVRVNYAFEFAQATVAFYVIGDVIIDEDAFFADETGEVSTVSVYQYEESVNEKKREVQLLDNAYLTNVIREFNKQTSDAVTNRENSARRVGEIV